MFLRPELVRDLKLIVIENQNSFCKWIAEILIIINYKMKRYILSCDGRFKFFKLRICAVWSECAELPCSKFSCKQGGTCSIRDTRLRCICPKGFRGRRCNKRKKENRRHKKEKYFSSVQIPILETKMDYEKYKYTIA